MSVLLALALLLLLVPIGNASRAVINGYPSAGVTMRVSGGVEGRLQAAAALMKRGVDDRASVALSAEQKDEGDEDDEEEGDDDADLALDTGDDPVDPDDKNFCYDDVYRKRTLKVLKEMPFIGLFQDLQDNVRFEASGITIAKGYAWVVFDSIRSIAKLDLHFNYFGEKNAMVPDLDEDPAANGVEDSQFEGLAYMASSDSFLVVRETFQHDEHSRILSRTEEIKFNSDLTGFHTVRECIVHFEFEDVNKGFEGIYYFEEKGKRYFMGLCESNYCKTIQGDDPPGLDRGNGRLVLAELVESKGDCRWDVVKVINIPESAFFLDYSVISFLGYMGNTVAIASQEDAAVWLGKFDWKNKEFKANKGKVYHFPRNDHCQKIYCNVEGLQFIDARRVVLTSDRSKSTQPHHCMHKDQSLAVMAIPKQ